MELTHLDANHNPNMVDVSNKSETKRVAVAKGTITMSQEAYESVISQTNKKGPVLQTAIVAAIMGAKKTSDLIPMCHPLFLSSVGCVIEENPANHSFTLTVTAKVEGKTGVEMEALTGVSIGLLTIYDMVKAIDKSMVMSEIYLVEKEGGKSGHFKNAR
ncbi:cyclic pyranopterin monophosphate synthase MoaC [Wolinella succinogenes]|uniref:Cyclic pyranopterin monophosphate synthase n=1 Tax=Wolinella succinogenes (strain ATCC 29543 / DSM 1740 / CCUG 13145 / JCM 31913 / LMG 7466 / NCTC 11488 / FDC 602W) TaxID=273121 RepID=Q7M950_WOLSU|nr:cyclic pyranopterin monophosphate synthase MoaC [Wolinella succinogenes]CAE10284.1 MOLYBDENUM COFACTOR BIOSYNTHESIS PROTEIN C [Wolinella succinogenes]VEG80270.1 Molybdenum cofactor biosynthesis protein C [Wolinella succinogenes]HCZ17963.1 cyclic pyranopterin monophosphate synthase MoaC [Helicobacter sp.]